MPQSERQRRAFYKKLCGSSRGCKACPRAQNRPSPSQSGPQQQFTNSRFSREAFRCCAMRERLWHPCCERSLRSHVSSCATNQGSCRVSRRSLLCVRHPTVMVCRRTYNLLQRKMGYVAMLFKTHWLHKYMDVSCCARASKCALAAQLWSGVNLRKTELQKQWCSYEEKAERLVWSGSKPSNPSTSAAAAAPAAEAAHAGAGSETRASANMAAGKCWLGNIWRSFSGYPSSCVCCGPTITARSRTNEAACQGDAIESDSEEQDDEPKVMNVDAKHKRPLDPENNNVLRIRKPGQA